MARAVRTYLEYFGSNLRRCRLKRGLTQEALATTAGMDARFIRRIERGSMNLRFDTIVRLADALDVEPAALLRKTKVVRPKPGRPRRKI